MVSDVGAAGTNGSHYSAGRPPPPSPSEGVVHPAPAALAASPPRCTAEAAGANGENGGGAGAVADPRAAMQLGNAAYREGRYEDAVRQAVQVEHIRLTTWVVESTWLSIFNQLKVPPLSNFWFQMSTCTPTARCGTTPPPRARRALRWGGGAS